MKAQQGLPAIARLVAQGLEGVLPLVTTTAGPTIGISLNQEGDGRLAVDLVNYAVDAASDRLEPARDVKLRIRPPTGRRISGSVARLRSPELVNEPADAAASGAAWSYREESLPVQITADGSAEITVPTLSVYAWLSLPMKQ